MKIAIAAMNIACICAVAASSASGGSYLYAPRPVEEGKEPSTSREEGVLVKEITIRRGDTLTGISRTYSGRGSYFPQILLFNDIKNPDLIYAGKALRVPVTKTVADEKREKEEREKPEKKEKAESTEKQAAREKRKKKKPEVSPPAPIKEKGSKARAEKERESAAPAVTPAPPSPSGLHEEKGNEQLLYAKAVRIYREGVCEDALPLLDTFLRRYPNSPLAPDITLFRADCYLKLSRE